MTKTFITNISVDNIIFGFDGQALKVLLIKRCLNPENSTIVIDDWTLTGHHIYEDEDIDEAAKRILKERTGLTNIYLEQFRSFGKRNRCSSEKDIFWLSHIDQRFNPRTLSVGYYSLVDSTHITLPEDGHAAWFPVDDLPELGFDHLEIIQVALKALREKLRSEPIGFELLPDKFTITQLQNLYESVLGTTYDRRNFRKKISQMVYVIPLNEKQKGVQHKPAQLFMFSKDIYLKTKKSSFDFST